MYSITEALVLGSVKYQDKNLIVKCYTREFGLVSYFIRNAFNHKNKLAVYFQPLNWLNITAKHRLNGSLEYIKEVSIHYNYQTIPFDFDKSSMALFLAEALNLSIKQLEADRAFFDFMTRAIRLFDCELPLPDFHLYFLINASKYLGFYPLDSENHDYFNPVDGVFEAFPSERCLPLRESALMKRLLTLEDLSVARFSQNERQILLKTLVHFFSLHIHGFEHLKSLDVLHELYV
ncbi:MAG TPA: DNA repair protein RecO [Flavobacterium sp.]|nr:DNA repair protein RecO [Flavobacterium sp.]